MKYYLRGLGVGIIVTSLVLGIGFGSRKETLSNEEIKERARALGMVEEPVTVAEAATQQEQEMQEAEADADPELKDDVDPELKDDTADKADAEPEVSSEPTMSASAEPETSAEPAVDAAEPTPGAEPTASAIPEVSALPEASASPEAGTGTAAETKEIVDITINPGEGSYAISSKLEQSGLIDDASEYDAYLCDNGYHTKLRAGVHKIPMGSTREEIAKLLCQ